MKEGPTHTNMGDYIGSLTVIRNVIVRQSAYNVLFLFQYSSRNEYYLGGTIALLLQDHRTMSTKSVSVCNSQYMVTDQH